MNIPNDLYFSKEHTWVHVENNIGTIGITDFAQSELGEIVLPMCQMLAIILNKTKFSVLLTPLKP